MMADDPHHFTNGRDRLSLGHALRVGVSVQLRAARRLVKHAALADVSADELTEKIVRSLLGTFEIRWKGEKATDESARRPDRW